MIDEKEITKRINYLTDRINRFRYHYYVKKERIVSDEEYNEELKELAKLYTKYRNDEIPKRGKIYTPPSMIDKINLWDKVLMDEFTDLDLKEFCQNIERKTNLTRIAYTVEHKVRGIEVMLEYIYGNLHSVIAHDGKGGHFEVTKNVLTIVDIPKYVPQLKRISSFIVKGVVYLRKQILNGLNKESTIEKLTMDILSGELDGANTLNAFMGYMHDSSPWHINSQAQEIKKLKTLGFNIQTEITIITTQQEIKEYLEELYNSVNKLEYVIEGIKITVDNLELQKRLGGITNTKEWVKTYSI